MDKHQLKELISTVLLDTGLHSTHAVDLLMETAAVESNLGQYIFQIGGPARGIFQMEPATEQDIWNNYIVFRDELKQRMVRYGYFDYDPDRLVYDLRYQILMARIHYLRVKEPIPATFLGRAKYWKKYYNTVNGKGSEHKYLLAISAIY